MSRFIDPLSQIFNKLKEAEGRFNLYKRHEAGDDQQYVAVQSHVLEAIKAATELDSADIRRSLALLFYSLNNNKINDIDLLLRGALNSVCEAICAEIGM